MANTALQQKVEKEVGEYKNLEKELSTLANNRSKLLTQLNENEMVKKELDIVTEDASVYKMIGPVLIKQDKNEAKSNVGKRIDFINTELKRLENSYKETENKVNEKRGRIMELQTALQRPTAKA